jgi:hypothetical protein
MSVELSDDATYSMRGVRSTSFKTLTSDVLDLKNVLYVRRLKKNLLSISCMVDYHCMAEFDAQGVMFRRQIDVVAPQNELYNQR